MRFAPPLTIAIAALVVSLGTSMLHAQGKRVALVIGNSAYTSTPSLENPKNDASDMADTLEGLGFQVVKGVDLTKSAMDRAIREFADALNGASVGLLFYAGHGVQVSGQNYLVPIDARLVTASALDFEMVRLDLIQRVMEAESKTNLIFLDACRDNPLARNLARALGTRSTQVGRGLASTESGDGTLISFSTQPGNVALDGTGRNSPFAAALLKHIRTQGEDLPNILIKVRNDVMTATERRQVPWEHSAMTARFFFAPPKAIESPPATPLPGTTTVYDGTWTFTRSAAPGCPASNARFMVRVEGGIIRGPGGPGTLSPSGEFHLPGAANHFTGTFSGDAGKGTYAGRCTGTFTAKRN